MSSFERFEPYLTNYDPLNIDYQYQVMCMDDRPREDGKVTAQYGGGAVGVGADIAVAETMGGSKGYYSGMPINHRGMQVADRLWSGRIDLFTHLDCKAELGIAAVADTILADPEVVYAQTQKFYSGFTRDEFEQVYNAYSQVKVADPEQAAADYDSGLQGKYGIVLRRRLRNMGHVAGDIIVTTRQNVAFESAEAMDAGNPAYHIGLGNIATIDEVLRQDDRRYQADPESWMKASLVRHAATSLFLPVPEGQSELRIHQI